MALDRGGATAFGTLTADWRGRSVYLIGGGPSLKGFDLRQLKGRGIVVAINDAVRSAPWADVAFTIDRTWLRRRRREMSGFAGEKLAAVPDGFPNLGGYTYLRRLPEAGLSADMGVLLAGGNSGFAALGMALMRGAGRVALLGYDLGAAGHFHRGYEWRSPYGAKDYPAWIDSFAVLAAAAGDTDIINCNPGSALRCFRFGGFEEIAESAQ